MSTISPNWNRPRSNNIAKLGLSPIYRYVTDFRVSGKQNRDIGDAEIGNSIEVLGGGKGGAGTVTGF
jgi:hypothetical protein